MMLFEHKDLLKSPFSWRYNKLNWFESYLLQGRQIILSLRVKECSCGQIAKVVLQLKEKKSKDDIGQSNPPHKQNIFVKKSIL